MQASAAVLYVNIKNEKFVSFDMFVGRVFFKYNQGQQKWCKQVL